MGTSEFDEIIDAYEKADEANMPFEVLLEAANAFGGMEDAIERFRGVYESEEAYADEMIDEGALDNNNLENYWEMSNTDKRILAGEEADNFVENMDEDEFYNHIDEYNFKKQLMTIMVKFFQKYQRKVDVFADFLEVADGDEELDILDYLVDGDFQNAGDFDANPKNFKKFLETLISGVDVQDFYANGKHEGIKSLENLIEDAREDFHSEKYEELKKELDDDAWGYLEYLGMEQESILKMGFIDTKRLGRDLVRDFYQIEHDGDIYLFYN